MRPFASAASLTHERTEVDNRPDGNRWSVRLLLVGTTASKEVGGWCHVAGVRLLDVRQDYRLPPD